MPVAFRPCVVAVTATCHLDLLQTTVQATQEGASCLSLATRVWWLNEMFQYQFVTCAVYRKILPGLARGISCVSVDRFRENISGGLLVYTWCQSMVRLPSMVASLPPIERLIITGRFLQSPCRPPTPAAQ